MNSQRSSLSGSQTGKARRLARLIHSGTGRTVIIPVDDGLIAGPKAGLERVESKLELMLTEPPNAILAFPALLRNMSQLLHRVGIIANLTASTSRANHTRKTLVADVHQAGQLGADAVAVHVNISSRFEHEMLAALGAVSRECEAYGMPLVGIMYPRTESATGDDNYEALKVEERKKYSELVAHCARVGVDLGADLIKTQYTGDPESFRGVVEACGPIPIVVAGGPKLRVEAVLQIAYDVILAGGAGVSFGRNVFGRRNPTRLISGLIDIIHHGALPQSCLDKLSAEDLRTLDEE